MKLKVNLEVFIISILPYGEADIIFSAINEERGLLKFFLKNDRRISKKTMPQIDLFREVSLECYEKKLDSDLIAVSKACTKRVYHEIARDYNFFLHLSWIAKFLTKNVFHGQHLNGILLPIKKILEKKEKGENVEIFAFLVAFILFFLVKEGFFAEEYLEKNAQDFLPIYNEIGKKCDFSFIVTRDEKIQTLTWLRDVLTYCGLKDCDLLKNIL